MKYRRILGWMIIAATIGGVSWGLVRDTTQDPSAIIGYGCAFLILGLPLALISIPRGRRVVQSRPQLFWFVGAGMLAVAILAIGGFVSLTMYNPSLPTIDGAIFAYCFVLLFGIGFMLLMTPTIFVVSNTLKRMKEEQ